MTTQSKRRRGTAIVEYIWQDLAGVLVLGDPKGQWLLPDGKAEGRESRNAAAIRALREETGLVADTTTYLFSYESYSSHKVFLARVQGEPSIHDPHAITAIGVCREDLTVVPIITRPDADLPSALSKATATIIARFFRERSARTADGRTTQTTPPFTDSRPMQAASQQSPVQDAIPSIHPQHVAAGGSWQLLDSLTVYHQAQPRTIEICQGDLADMPAAEAVDVMVVSALPNDYQPYRSSLIGALHRNGVSVEDLAQDKAVDLRPNLACWLSKPVKRPNSGIQFNRVLCFEPQDKGTPPEVVGDIFQCLISCTQTQSIRQVAMPLLGGGAQGVATVDMIIPLFDAATHWLELGLPIERLKIVAYSDRSAAELQGAFGVLKHQYELRQAAAATAAVAVPTVVAATAATPTYTYDLFISYCWQNKDDVDFLVAELKHQRPGLRIFLDRTELNTGCAWQQKILDALDDCRKIVTVYSPAYLTSKVCREEFNIALFRHRDRNDVLLPIYLETAPLPTYMKVTQYIDCRERDQAKLKQASASLVAQV